MRMDTINAETVNAETYELKKIVKPSSTPHSDHNRKVGFV
jgi:hypothetical protein